MWPWSRRKARKEAVQVLAIGGRQGHMVNLVRGTYDAAKTTEENRRHWANADQLSPIAAASSDVRSVLRARARYEVANNSIARGVVLTLANDLIGTGPRLQLQTDDGALNRQIEMWFGRWSVATNLGAKLRTMRYSRAQDGEAFAMMFTNPKVVDPVKLDLALVEAERVAMPTAGLLPEDERKAVDGIEFDEFGNPTGYHVLVRHPGARDMTYKELGNVDRVDAASMLHWFRQDRPGQRRGLPDIMPALPLFALLRRYTLATVTAAETAADLSLVMKTTSPPGGEAAEVEPWVVMEIERNTAMFAPEGWEPSQLKSEHPSGVWEPFRRAIISEIARCLNMPYLIAAADSSNHNYASGRLDHQTYFKNLRVERGELAGAVLDRVFTAWLKEALRVLEYQIFGQIERIRWPHDWVFDGREHVDPLKEAKAAECLRKNALLSSARYYAAQGLDWEAEMRQLAVEKALREELDLPDPTQPKAPAGAGAGRG